MKLPKDSGHEAFRLGAKQKIHDDEGDQADEKKHVGGSFCRETINQEVGDQIPIAAGMSRNSGKMRRPEIKNQPPPNTRAVGGQDRDAKK